MFLYGADVDATKTSLTVEFYCRWKLINDGRFQRERDVWEITKRWMANNLFVDDEAADWVLEPKGRI